MTEIDIEVAIASLYKKLAKIEMDNGDSEQILFQINLLKDSVVIYRLHSLPRLDFRNVRPS